MSKKANERSLPQCVELDAKDVGVRLPRGLRVFDVRVADDDEWPCTRDGRSLLGSELVEYVLRFRSTEQSLTTGDLRGLGPAAGEIKAGIGYLIKEARRADVAPKAIAICNFAVVLLCDSGRGDPWAKTDP